MNETENQSSIEWLRREIAIGIKALDEGRSSVFDDGAVARIEASGRKLLAERRIGRSDHEGG